jgi:hypothetical protein
LVDDPAIEQPAEQIVTVGGDPCLEAFGMIRENSSPL